MTDYTESERTASTYKGATFMMRTQSSIINTRPAGILFRQSSLNVPEGVGGQARPRLFVRLASRPTANVRVNTAAVTVGGMTVTPDPLNRVFTAANWDTWQFYRMGASEDNDGDDTEVTLVFTPENAGGYSPSLARNFTVTVTDND